MDRSMLARATEGTDAPTPGYLYVDLAKAASSNPAVCQEMASYLTRRLASKNNPNIQYKCCKVIAKLADSVPRNQFRRCIAQDPSAVSIIKQATAFRGTLDPVRGDQPNQRVRDAAKEALDAVYRETPSSEQQYTTASNISASYGPSPHYSGGGYSGGGGGGGRMDGIGNPRYSDPRYGPQQPTNFREAVKEAREVVVGMIKDPLARHVDMPAAPNVPRQGHSGDLPGYNRSQHYGRPPPGSAELSRETGGQWTMASNRGPGAIQYQQQPQQPHTNGASDSYYKERDTSFQWAKQQGGAHSSSSGAVGGSWASAGAGPTASSSSSVIRPHSTPSVTINTLPSSGGGGGDAASDGTYEKNLVLELCPPGGMKAVPPPDKLASFARSVSSLNSDLICPVLLDCLEEGQPWIIRAKALCVMETCIQHGTRPADGSNPYRDFFHACLDEITPLANHPRAAISQPAQRVLTLLGVASAGGGTANGGSVAAPPVAAAPNLLDFDDDDDAPATPAPAPASQPQPPPPAATAAPSSGQSTMFGGMQVKAGGGGGGSVTSPAPAAPVSNGDLLGDFGATPAPSENTNTAAAATGMSSAPPSDMFAQMHLKAGNNNSAAAAAAAGVQPAANSNSTVSNNLASLAAPAGGGSAFGFINESAPKDSTDKAATAEQAKANSKNPESFDPLKNVTPQSSQQRKMMQLSPEQMQAMAYQQQVFHMQQQQMQMMLAMQHQQGGMMHHPVGQLPMFPAMGGVMPPQGAGHQQQRFSFKDTRPAKKDDKKFDFVKDAMHTAGQKK